MSCTVAHTVDQFCYDQATPVQREAFDFLHRHAYDWASVGGELRRDQAEEYAGHYAGHHFADDIDDAPAHPAEFERWLAASGG